MSKKDLVFRIKTPHGIVQINNLTNEDKFLDLKTSLIATTGINRLKVLHGYPPKELDLTLEQTKLGNYFKSSRETLIVSENKLGNVKASTQIDDDIQIINTLPPSNTSTILNGYNSKNGRLTRKVVPANNSCLFTAVYFCIRNGTFNAEIGSELRKIIVATVKDNPKQFNEGILGCTTEEYCSKIIRDDVWGGSIELKILSDYYAIEIVAVDIQNLRLNRFGEDHNYSSRIFLIYDGIHYDALYFETTTKQVVTIFSTKNTELLTLALELAKEANASRQYTDVKNFKLKCLACNEAFVGSKEADQHAKKTSHINFGEF